LSNIIEQGSCGLLKRTPIFLWILFGPEAHFPNTQSRLLYPSEGNDANQAPVRHFWSEPGFEIFRVQQNNSLSSDPLRLLQHTGFLFPLLRLQLQERIDESFLGRRFYPEGIRQPSHQEIRRPLIELDRIAF
jgi:hypothetical protein